MFGGTSPEHEVSVVTGLQALEALDTEVYTPHVIYISKENDFYYLPKLKSRKGFLKNKRVSVSFGKNQHGGFVRTNGFFSKSIYPYAALLAFHGGGGEGGKVQGLLETCNIAHSSPSIEGSVIALNKQITKNLASQEGVRTVPGLSFTSVEIRKNTQEIVEKCCRTLGDDLIVKPVHLGSSIGLDIAHSKIELEKALLKASHVDNEILVETLLTDFVEYNCSVRENNGVIETSEIERPLSKEAFLSFAEKYEKGGKKTAQQGMASLNRELPADISESLRSEIQETAKKVFRATRQSQMVRIDFMYTKDRVLYLTEVNSIPGSLAFYLWEATGEPYTQQFSLLIENARQRQVEFDAQRLDYDSSIVEKFIDQ